MLLQKNKKILIYIFLFLVIGTLNNKNFNKFDFGRIENISVKGLDEKNNLTLLKKLYFLENKNIFFIDKIEIEEIIKEVSLIEKYSVFRLYPSSLNIKIEKTNFLAVLNRNGDRFFLGSNGKFIKSDKFEQNLPNIFGEFKVENFFKLKNAMDKANFDYDKVKNLFFFKSGRWDIETKNDILIKLPNKDIKRSLELFINFSKMKNLDEIKEIDLRQNNQIITNG